MASRERHEQSRVAQLHGLSESKAFAAFSSCSARQAHSNYEMVSEVRKEERDAS